MDSFPNNNHGVPRKYYILVDYDNFVLNVLGDKRHDSTFPLFDIVRQLDQSSDFFQDSTPKSKVFIHLYGGWYFHDRLSFDAQDLSALRYKKMVYTRDDVPLYLQFDLAVQLFSTENQGKPLFSTFRSQKCSTCPKCGTQQVRPILDARQKMVDTMLCCDFLFLSSKGIPAAVVSSDDDLFPPLLQQSTLGSPVYHVMTSEKPSPSFEQYYAPLLPTNYKLIFRS